MSVIPIKAPAADLQLGYQASWLSEPMASQYLDQLLAQTPWQQPQVRVYGKKYPVPRLMAWYGDAGASYGYSGLRHQPLPWTQLLARLRQQVEQACSHAFNGVLLNLYRDGQDANGWHSDDEPELGSCPLIASVSLGAARRFDLRRRDGSGQRISLELAHGSLLVMAGATQQYWQHQIARTNRVREPRLNLTFRYVQP